MKSFFILLLCASAQLWAAAQKTLPEYGSVSLADLQLKECSFDKGAPALKLFDTQEVTLEETNAGTLRLVTERRVRIKIFNPAGFEAANIKLPYYSKNRVGKIKELSGVVYNLGPNETIVAQKLEKKDFFKEKPEDKVRVINFTFPNIKAGSVVEYRYKKIERNTFQVDPWILQSAIPTAYASITLTTPSYSRVKEKIFGTDTIPHTVELISHTSSYNERRRFYYKENIKAFQPEPFMTSFTDNLMRVVFMIVPQSNFFTDVFVLSPSMWSNVGNVLLQASFFGKQIQNAIPGTQPLIDSAQHLSCSADKINFIYERVKKQFVGRDDQTAYPNSIAEAWNSRSGNSAEINLALLNLLRQTGIEAYPLLVSTREHGLIAVDFPSFAQINGVDVVALDSSHVYVLDAYAKFHSYKTPPFNVLNRNGFLLDSANMRWVKVTEEGLLARDNVAVFSELKDDGTVHGNANIQSRSYAKINALDSSEAEEKETRGKSDKQLGLTILSSKTENETVDSLPLVQNVDFSYKLENTDSFYFMNPLFLTARNQNPFASTERNTDLDFGCNQLLSIQLFVKIPKGYTVESLPKSVYLRSSDTAMVFNRTTFADSTGVVFRQSFQMTRSLYGKEEFEGIKTFFDKMYGLMSEEIIFKKVR